MSQEPGSGRANRCEVCGEHPAAHKPTRGCLHEGWTNAETFHVALYLTNDRRRLAHWMDEADELERMPGRPGPTAVLLADKIRQKIRQRVKDAEPEPWALDAGRLYADLLTGALARVEWLEIAQDLLEKLKEETARTDQE